MKIVCISDTHGIHEPKDLPDGDILIHAGDLTLGGQVHEVAHALGWLRKFPHKYKIVIGGNHDNALAELPGLFEEQWKPYKGLSPLIYLAGRSFKTEEGPVVFGSSVIFHNDIFRAGARAYMLDGTTAWHWNVAPTCDILVTHGPPKWTLDGTYGDPALAVYVRQVKPKLHVFGHVHSGYGVAKTEHTTYVNAAMVDDEYRPANREPIVIEI